MSTTTQNINTETTRTENKFNRVKSLLEDLIPYIKLLYLKKKIILIVTGIVTLVFFIIFWFFTNVYFETTVTILPETNSSSTLSSLSGLASLAGISLSNSTTSTSIYQNLLYSEAVWENVINSKFKLAGSRDSVNLIQYFKVEPPEGFNQETIERSMFLTVYKYFTEGGGLVTNVDPATSVLTVTIRMPSGKMAAMVTNKLTEALNNYLIYKKQSNATNTRKYIEERLLTVTDSLKAAEEILKNFNEQNRIISQSPELQLKQNRLSRNVSILSQTYTTLRNQLELAKIEEVKNVPVVNIREPAADPVIPAGPRRGLYLALIILFTFVSTSAIIILRPKISNYWKLFKDS
ncbi:MAG: hypothetical protein Kow0098_14310 [Ignavibacteriaceae bacterium]